MAASLGSQHSHYTLSSDLFAEVWCCFHLSGVDYEDEHDTASGPPQEVVSADALLRGHLSK